MTRAAQGRVQLSRIEEARRQTQRQLDIVERRITRRLTAIMPRLQPRRTGHRRGRPSSTAVVLECYRANLAALTAERQHELDALSRTLAHQDTAIAAFRDRSTRTRTLRVR